MLEFAIKSDELTEVVFRQVDDVTVSVDIKREACNAIFRDVASLFELDNQSPLVVVPGPLGVKTVRLILAQVQNIKDMLGLNAPCGECGEGADNKPMTAH